MDRNRLNLYHCCITCSLELNYVSLSVQWFPFGSPGELINQGGVSFARLRTYKIILYNVANYETSNKGRP